LGGIPGSFREFKNSGSPKKEHLGKLHIFVHDVPAVIIV
jgi:hypothetical protein